MRIAIWIAAAGILLPSVALAAGPCENGPIRHAYFDGLTLCVPSLHYSSVGQAVAEGTDARAGAAASISTRIGADQIYRVAAPYQTVHIGAPAILNVSAISDRDVVLHPLANGYSSVLFLDSEGRLVDRLDVDINDTPIGRVKLHNKEWVNSYTALRCQRSGCEYVDELTVKEPVPVAVPRVQNNIVLTTPSAAAPPR